VKLDPMERLIAESEIRNVVARLAHLADDAKLDEYLDLYTEDGSWGHDDNPPFVGREGLRAGAEQRIHDQVQGLGTGRRHINTTLAVTVVGPDDATAESYFLYLATKDVDHPQVLGTGRYLDRFRRTPDGWKLASRRIVTGVN
jgi:3-phenylpropionate/cinnamic acid dioxygenase small subunit